jgi:hypothetical protein
VKIAVLRKGRTRLQFIRAAAHFNVINLNANMMSFREIFLFSTIGILMVVFPGPIRKAIGDFAGLLVAFQIREKKEQIKSDLSVDNPIMIRVLGGVCIFAAFAGLIIRLS